MQINRISLYSLFVLFLTGLQAGEPPRKEKTLSDVFRPVALSVDETLKDPDGRKLLKVEVADGLEKFNFLYLLFYIDPVAEADLITHPLPPVKINGQQLEQIMLDRGTYSENGKEKHRIYLQNARTHEGIIIPAVEEVIRPPREPGRQITDLKIYMTDGVPRDLADGTPAYLRFAEDGDGLEAAQSCRPGKPDHYFTSEETRIFAGAFGLEYDSY